MQEKKTDSHAKTCLDEHNFRVGLESLLYSHKDFLFPEEMARILREEANALDNQISNLE